MSNLVPCSNEHVGSGELRIEDIFSSKECTDKTRHTIQDACISCLPENQELYVIIIHIFSGIQNHNVINYKFRLQSFQSMVYNCLFHIKNSWSIMSLIFSKFSMSRLMQLYLDSIKTRRNAIVSCNVTCWSTNHHFHRIWSLSFAIPWHTA